MSEFRESYASAFGDYVREGEEGALQAAYELGRDAVRRDLSVLDLATVHHDVLRSALARASSAQELERTAGAAGDFFIESLSAFEMLRRGYREAQEEALLEKRQAAIVRQLSSFLADASLAMGAADSLVEVAQLVAEHAREIVDANRCAVSLSIGDTIEAVSLSDVHVLRETTDTLAVPLTGLDGREFGVITLVDKRRGAFSELDEAVLVQLAQMASAAVERTRLYLRTAS